MRRLLVVLLFALASVPAQAQSRAVVKWHASHPLWMLRGDIVTAAGVVTPGSGGGGVGLGGTNVWTGSNTFTDSLFTIQDDGDNTKKLQVQLTGITTGNTVTPFYFAGTAALPEVRIGPNGTTTYLSFKHDGTNGFIDAVGGNTAILVRSAGTNKYYFAAGELRAGSAIRLGFASTVDPVTAADDAFFRRGGAAASIQMGDDLNGAAINQTFRACQGITGTDIAGCGLTLGGGAGTGANASNPLTLNRQVTKATGTTAQTYAPAVIVCSTKLLSTTSATTTTVADITTTSTTGGSVTWDYTVIANNGTLQDVDGGILKVLWGNNAGTVTSTATAITLQADADASGTLAATPTRTDATNVVSLKLTPTWVTIVPTTVTAISIFTVATVGDTVSCK